MLFSPGLNTNVAFYTGLLQELASKGFTVAGVDHTFDALVEFPDGRIEPPAENASLETLLAVRVADMGLVRDRLADHRRVAVAGHSLSSMTAIGALARDSRFTTGVALDANPLGGVFELGPIGGRRAVRIGRTYLTAWLSHTLLGRTEPLLRHESPAFGEVDFQP